MIATHALPLAALALATPLLFAQDKAKEKPTLEAGMPAPALAVESWLKGAPIERFEAGKVYVVEFWATWCGPCIATMPHLSALQADYKDRGVTIIGTNIWEDEEYGDSTLPKVKEFLAKQGDRMGYTVAYDGPAKKMDASFMRAAGRNGIPSSFIVDKNGVIAWIGHPARMDFALSEIVAGTWDVKTGPDREKKVLGELAAISKQIAQDPAAAQAAFDAFAAAHPAVAKHQDDLKLDLLKGLGRWEQVWEVLGKKVDAAIARKDAMELNDIAWGIVDPEAKVAERNAALALRAALKADEFSESKSPAILDTLARCYATQRDFKKAIEVQTRAVAAATGKMKESLQEALDEYTAKAAQ